MWYTVIKETKGGSIMDQKPFEQNTEYNASEAQASTPIAAPAPKNGFAIASLVLGIVSLLSSCCFSCLIPVTAILSIVFAVVSKKGNPMSGMALGGMICSIISLLLLAFSFAFLLLNPDIVAELEQAFMEGLEAGMGSY